VRKKERETAEGKGSNGREGGGGEEERLNG